MAFHVFDVLGSLGGIWPPHLLMCLPRLPRTSNTWNTIGICRVFIVPTWKNVENHWNMYGFHFLFHEKYRNHWNVYVFHSGTKKTYIFQGFCMFFIKKKTTTYSNGFPFFHSKSVKTIHIPMMFYVFEVLGSLGGIWPPHLLFACQDFPGPQKPEKTLEYVWVSLILNEKKLGNHWNM